MKSFIFALTLGLSPLAFAGFSAGNSTDADINYVSWCSAENQVLTLATSGEVALKQDCNELGKTCVEVLVNKPHVHQIYATCK